MADLDPHTAPRLVQHLARPASQRWVAAAGALLLVVSTVSIVVRAPAGSRLSIAGGVPDGRGGTVDLPAPSAEASIPVPPGSALAPRPMATPEGQGRAPTPMTGIAGVGTATPEDPGDDVLVVPDGDSGPGDPVPAPTAAAPPAPPPTTPVGAPAGDTPRARFESQFPAHAAASQDAAEPVTTRWAVLVGVNEHSGRTRDNVGSRQDAQSLYAHLMELGWAPDHVLLLTDGLATRETMIEAVHWLARQTTGESVAVFSYSGHAKQWPGQDMDGDGEVPDEGLWPSDNRHIVDGEFRDLMATVTAGRMWLNFMACEAAGFLDPGLVRDGRIVTFSSAEDEKSYEDPSVGHSVWGWNLVVQGFRRGAADANEDGEVTVQEATTFAVPRAATRTRNQAFGSQNGGMVDHSGGIFSLAIPAPPPPPEPAPEPSPDPTPSPSPSSCVLVVCNGRDD